MFLSTSPRAVMEKDLIKIKSHKAVLTRMYLLEASYKSPSPTFF